jgi:hypothetical protein
MQGSGGISHGYNPEKHNRNLSLGKETPSQEDFNTIPDQELADLLSLTSEEKAVLNESFADLLTKEPQKFNDLEKELWLESMEIFLLENQ